MMLKSSAADLVNVGQELEYILGQFHTFTDVHVILDFCIYNQLMIPLQQATLNIVLKWDTGL